MIGLCLRDGCRNRPLPQVGMRHCIKFVYQKSDYLIRCAVESAVCSVDVVRVCVRVETGDLVTV